MLIGRHGQTIDAVQYLANAVMWRRHPEDRKEVVVDAAGYRERRRVAFEALALRAADRALSDHEPVELEPMTAVERKIVHLRLKELDGVETTSEGTEPTATSSSIPSLEDWLRRPLRRDAGSDRDQRSRGGAARAAGRLAARRGARVGVRGADRRRGLGRRRPGIPLAVSLPDREVTLLEAIGRKCDFLREWAQPNVRVVQGRAEEQETDVYGVAVAKALAKPPVAAEWCLPLVAPGGAVVLWVGPTADASMSRAWPRTGRRRARGTRPGSSFCAKCGPTPDGFPRRTGVAKKRPLA